MSSLSIRSKLLVMLLGVSAISILVVAWLAYRSGSAGLTETAFAHLTSVRASKAHQIETYFENVHNQVETLGEDHMIAEAMVAFRDAFAEIDRLPVLPEWDAGLVGYYRQEFLPRLAKNVEGTPVAEGYLPGRRGARYLQYHYVSSNPNPVGEKHRLDDPGDDSRYSEIHARYQPIFRKLVDKFGYYDMFLIDVDSGDIVYSVYKETDYATSLLTGPYKTSNLARAVAAVQGSRDKGFVKLADFAEYRPSYAAPASFLATPIYRGDEILGVLAFQISVAEINRVMTGNESWAADGLGESGETYLVGPDYLMRSVSRFLVEDAEGYAAALGSVGVPEQNIQRILRLGTTILQQEVRTDASLEALQGKSGTRVVDDYRGIPVLSSYAPLSLPGLRWGILSEMDLAEANAPATAFARQILVSSGLIMLGLTVVVMALASYFVRPVNRLMNGIRQVGSGKTDHVFDSRSDDEFGELARSFNEMVDGVRTQTQLAEERNRENEDLLGTILPAAIARRIKAGEKSIADDHDDATVLFSDLEGFTELARSMKARESVTLLNDVVSAFDESAEEHGVEKIKTIGDGYMAACGVSTPRLDHAQRSVDFARDMQRIVRRFNREHGLSLGLRIGVHAGPLVAGIVGRKQFLYDLWGDTVNLAYRLKGQAELGEIRVSQMVRDKLGDLYAFERVSGDAEKAGVFRLDPEKDPVPEARRG